MGFFFTFGLMTFGVGVLAAWATAGGSMISEGLAEEEVHARNEALEREYEQLRELRV